MILKLESAYKKLKAVLPTLIVIAGLYLVFHLLGISCPIKFMTGISCPGCGMTRAVLSATAFHFAKAFSYHPLWVLMPVWAAVLLLREDIPPVVFRIFSAVTVLLFGIVYILRMYDTNDMIVVFNPEDGFWFRIVRQVINMVF